MTIEANRYHVIHNENLSIYRTSVLLLAKCRLWLEQLLSSFDPGGRDRFAIYDFEENKWIY